GLASHGGAIGIVVALWLFSKYVSKKSIIWILDRVVIPTALGGAFIRLGNFFNHEIYGIPTDLSWGVIFRYGEDALARHPTQIYEALTYLVLFIVLIFLFFKTEARQKTGLIFGIFLIILFSGRFFIEFIKENQEIFEDDMMLNMGQWLSIPFVIFGIGLIIYNMIPKKPQTQT
ncbi:MAG: prolipoprotein diacylglyceryl transferase, partial [Bacteroidota bacterium]|nr:prolipoprotein diacylglyceryl transferase [Bacteroidota bacterium]